MFEKSLVDLIRGLRSHKGSEAEYIQSALKECRAEIRSQDMDVKATALLKMLYLEMFGYDMTWAAFNVLEVMSSAKQLHKRIGYLGAVQTFRPDTEVLMLATNLLKKDLSSPLIPVMNLPLVTLPHIITSSLALSVLTDILPRLSHSQPTVRKKTVVSLYRLALVYPEALRVAWPKMKDMLLDEQENSSVTAATVNVVCELGWRRPQDFLSLAPRLFELLVDGGNNWMAIKIIKLFAVLTPLEPRLVKKLVRPLMNLIQTTTAMSLLYECINGIIQGGILSGTDVGVEQDEVANLCIKKLREMVLIDGDPNLKYVALLAFNKVAVSYSALVSMQEDVILGSLDDPDISIRLQALELSTGIVNGENLQSVVNKLIRQFARAPNDTEQNDPGAEQEMTDLEQKLVADKRGQEKQPLPPEYKREVISRILDMCSKNHYANIVDFEWYLDILVRLVGLLPSETGEVQDSELRASGRSVSVTVSDRIGHQLLDIAVRVKELRPETTRAAEKLILISNRTTLFPSDGTGMGDVLKSVAWVVGEYSTFLNSPYDTLNSLIQESSASLPFATLSVYVQAIPKIFVHIAKTAAQEWNPNQKATLSLILARIIDFLEKLATHPNIEVQERSVEYLELLRLASEALSSAPLDDSQPPALIITAMPALFEDSELNPVAAGAQRKVPLPAEINLDGLINTDLPTILEQSQTADDENVDFEQFNAFYHEREAAVPVTSLSSGKLVQPVQDDSEPASYQSAPESPSTVARRKAERRIRNRDDPFYIPHSEQTSGIATPIHEILSQENGQDLDIDAIPIINLQLDSADSEGPALSKKSAAPTGSRPKKKKSTVKRFNVISDETVEGTDPDAALASSAGGEGSKPDPFHRHRTLLSVDSSTLGSFDLHQDVESRRRDEEAEMAAALREVERLRLEMQRKAEAAEGADREGTVVVKRKKKKKAKIKKDGGGEQGAEGEEEETVVKRKKKKKKTVPEGGGEDGGVLEEAQVVADEAEEMNEGKTYE